MTKPQTPLIVEAEPRNSDGFASEPYDGPQPGEQRFTAPRAGLYRFDKQLPYAAHPGGVMEVTVTQTAPGLMFDPGELRAAIGERIAVNGPRTIHGILRSVDTAEDGLSVTLRVEVEHVPNAGGHQQAGNDD